MRGVSRWLLLALIALLPTWGAQITIDFNTLTGPVTNIAFPGGTVIVTVARMNGSSTVITNANANLAGTPTGWGAGALANFPTGGNVSSPILVTIAMAPAQTGTPTMTGASVQFGDHTGQDTDTIVLSGCTAATGLTGCTSTTTTGWTAGLPTVGTISVGPSLSAASLVLSGGSGGNQNIYFDNLVIDYTVTQPPPPDGDGGDGGDGGGEIPEPGTMAIMASGLIALGFLRRRS